AEPFSAPQMITEIVADGDETSPAISSDGLTLWFGSTRSGGLGEGDIWMSTRASRSAAWATPVDLAALRSTARDGPRPLGDGTRVMPMSSERTSADGYQTFFATARAAGGPLESPTPIPELVVAGLQTVDAFLTDDGLTIFYSRGPSTATSDLFVS